MAKRSRLLIDPTVQWSLALRVLLHWALLVVCLLMINTVISLLMMAGQKPLTSAVADAFRSQLPLLVVLAVLVPVFVRDTLKLSNRFAGPMYRLRTEMKRLKDGESVQRIKLRDGDFWVEVAEDFNEVARELERSRREIALISEVSEVEETIPMVTAPKV